jgi:hypothetical protein
LARDHHGKSVRASLGGSRGFPFGMSHLRRHYETCSHNPKMWGASGIARLRLSFLQRDRNKEIYAVGVRVPVDARLALATRPQNSCQRIETSNALGMYPMEQHAEKRTEKTATEARAGVTGHTIGGLNRI